MNLLTPFHQTKNPIARGNGIGVVFKAGIAFLFFVLIE